MLIFGDTAALLVGLAGPVTRILSTHSAYLHHVALGSTPLPFCWVVVNTQWLSLHGTVHALVCIIHGSRDAAQHYFHAAATRSIHYCGWG